MSAAGTWNSPPVADSASTLRLPSRVTRKTLRYGSTLEFHWIDRPWGSCCQRGLSKGAAASVAVSEGSVTPDFCTSTEATRDATERLTEKCAVSRSSELKEGERFCVNSAPSAVLTMIR